MSEAGHRLPRGGPLEGAPRPARARGAAAGVSRTTRTARIARAACAGALLAAAAAAATPPTAPVRVDAPWFSCRSGKYAVTLSTHYPSLFNIGRHRVSEVEVRHREGGSATARRIRYIGLELDVMVSPREPSRYQLLRADVSSRRWNIGRLSVGERPWRWGREPSLRATPLEGWIELVGDGDSVRLLMTDGRVDRAIYACRTPPRP